MTGPKDEVALAALLGRASEVLQGCADTVVTIENLLDLIGHPVIDPSQRLALQEFDRLSQRLVDLSVCLGQLALAQPFDRKIDPEPILSPLRLHDLRLFLSGQTPVLQAHFGQVALF